MKRLIDIVSSILLLVIMLPVFLFAVIWIKLDSRGPIFFVQQRVGLHGREFGIYKFRSMVIDAESSGPYNTQENDPRITGAGVFLRKTSIDELPQLINVLKGDMSLVGPRPNLLRQKVEYSEQEWDKRNSVRPGITGLAQARLRSLATPEQRTQLDLEYVDRQGVIFDIMIMLMTVKRLFSGGSI
ncbi:MAG: sugar transferase [Gammaproteobacteria bacterium]|nr:sugar transferase [Gammaproteobacteria bacterium]